MLPNELADLIEFRREDIVETWMQAVRSDPRIHSDDVLHEDDLRNHIPDIIEEICQLLREGEAPRAANTREARVHTYTRYRQGYRGRDLVCELSLLRLTLFDIVAESLMNGGTALKSFVETSKTINLYIDEELRYAISVYTEADKETQPPGASQKEPSGK